MTKGKAVPPKNRLAFSALRAKPEKNQTGAALSKETEIYEYLAQYQPQTHQ